MTTQLDPTLLPALDAIFGERPAPRHYAPEPAADYHAMVFKMQCERDRALRELMADREEEPARRDYESDEQFFLEQQCPADSNFR